MFLGVIIDKAFFRITQLCICKLSSKNHKHILDEMTVVCLECEQLRMMAPVINFLFFDRKTLTQAYSLFQLEFYWDNIKSLPPPS